MSTRRRYSDAKELICDDCDAPPSSDTVVMRSYIYPEDTKDVCDGCFLKWVDEDGALTRFILNVIERDAQTYGPDGED